MRAVLYRKPGCHLCETMHTVLEEVRKGFELEVEEKDVTADPDLVHLEASVPLLTLDGRPTFRFRMTAEALERVLAERGCPPSSSPASVP